MGTINANQLRIGNLLFSVPNQKVVTVSISTIRKIQSGKRFAEPIPLTEEWLLKFGKDNEYTIEIKAGTKIITFKWSSRIVSNGYRRGWICKKYKHIKYVHQLQNLYFALTQKELIFKQ